MPKTIGLLLKPGGVVQVNFNGNSSRWLDLPGYGIEVAAA